MRALATWCFRHRRTTLLLWLAALALATLLSYSTGTNYSNGFTLPNTESTRALAVLESVAPKLSGDVERVVFATHHGVSVRDPQVRQSVDEMLGDLLVLPHVTAVVSPYVPAGAHQVAPGDLIAYATVTFDTQGQNVSTSEAQRFVRVAQSAAGPNVSVAVAGQVAERAIPPSIGGTGPAILLAGVVLLIVFGSLFAMALPLVSALASLGTAIGIIGALSNVLKMPEFSPQLVLLIGLGVGIDYALFIVTRHRQGLMAGWDVESSVVNAVDTSGRAVLFAGIIVCIALLGMFAMGVSFLNGLAVSASIGVAFTMLSALTLLPAMLGFIGPKVMSRTQRRRLASSGPRVVGSGARGFWTRWAAFEVRRPLFAALGALVVVVLVSLPFFSLRLGMSDQGNDPSGTTTRTAYDLLASGFGPGYNGPLQVVVVRHHAPDPTLVTRLATTLAAHRGVAGVAPPVALPPKDGTYVTLLSVYPTTAPQDAATTALIDELRAGTIPKLVAGTGATVLVGGTTAAFVDFARVLGQKLPLFIGLVVALSFLLLAIVFRSLVIPLTAAVMNVLSIGAALGVLVAVFQNGIAASLIGVGRAGPIEAYLPVMLFAILFGLSMDYEVFLISRIHEEWLRAGDNRTAVRKGLAATGKTITAAALIMILIFASFILGGVIPIKEAGVGLAVGVFMDAVLIRMALVPAVMVLFGRANWWFPRWLDRLLPRVGIDSDAVDAMGLDDAVQREPVAA